MNFNLNLFLFNLEEDRESAIRDLKEFELKMIRLNGGDKKAIESRLKCLEQKEKRLFEAFSNELFVINFTRKLLLNDISDEIFNKKS